MFPLRSTCPWGKRGLDRANLPVPKGGAALSKNGGERLCVTLKQPEAAGSASSWQAVSWAVPGRIDAGTFP